MDASQLIDKQIASLADWRGERYSQLRKLINEADPQLKEEFKWGTAVWSHNGLVCAIGAFKDHLKVNFFKGVELSDPDKLLNSGEGKAMRSINLLEGEQVNEKSLQELVRTAVENNK